MKKAPNSEELNALTGEDYNPFRHLLHVAQGVLMTAPIWLCAWLVLAVKP